MKVILKEDVKGLGSREDMVNVSNGYARNFLLPRGIAVEVSAANLNVMKARKDALKTKEERDHAHALELAERLKQMSVVIRSKAGENLRLFGSVTGKDISEELNKKFRVDIDKKRIILEEPIRSVGEHEVDIKLSPGVSAKLMVKVEAE
ncbi:MAG: 50S ribosomal protein L9 [Oscillospiraceae bacterium]|nr:50S ribosomal protein L9 [Oscillospiraceae bacterium]